MRNAKTKQLDIKSVMFNSLYQNTQHYVLLIKFTLKIHFFQK